MVQVPGIQTGKNGGEEIYRRHRFQVGANELSPAQALASFRSRFDAVALEDIGHGLVPYLIPEVAQRPGNRQVSPTTVVAYNGEQTHPAPVWLVRDTSLNNEPNDGRPLPFT